MGKLRQTTAKIQELLDKVENGEAGGGGLKYAVERTAYVTKGSINIDEMIEEEDYEITDEQRAYNIETLEMVARGDNVIMICDGYIFNIIGTAVLGGVTTNAYFAYALPYAGDFFTIELELNIDGNAEGTITKSNIGLQYSTERTLYGLEEEEMTDEQKAYNAETYSKMWSGEAVTINVGGIILTSLFSTTEDEYVSFGVSVDSDGIKAQFIIKLYSDGSVEVSTTVGIDDSLVIVIKYGDPESAKAVFADPMFFYKRIVLSYGLTLVDLNVKSLPITTDGKTFCVLGYQLEGTECFLTYDVDTGEILEEETTSDTLKVYIDVSNTENRYASYNRDAVSGQNTYKNLVVGDNYSERAVYYPLYSYKTDNSNIEVVIYRNGAFQRWRINADGTSTLTA